MAAALSIGHGIIGFKTVAKYKEVEWPKYILISKKYRLKAKHEK